MSDNILELKKITKNFPGVKALDNANFSLKKNQSMLYLVKMVQVNLH